MGYVPLLDRVGRFASTPFTVSFDFVRQGVQVLQQEIQKFNDIPHIVC